MAGIGLISDIHGNAPALRAVLDELDVRGVSQVLCGGDLVGYYPFVNEVIEMLREREIPCVMGNHDAMLVGRLAATEEQLRRRGLDHARSVISDDNLHWVGQLPETRRFEFDDVDLQMWHGSPWQPFEEYIYPDHEDFSRFESLDCDVAVLGHTHWPLVKTLGRLRIINPGSVGQPRDYEPRAAFAVLEPPDAQVHLCRADYDVASVAASAAAAGADADVLAILSRRRQPRAEPG